MEWMIALCVLIAIGIVALLFAVVGDEVRRRTQVNEEKKIELATSVCKPHEISKEEIKALLKEIESDKRAVMVNVADDKPTQWWHDRAWAVKELKKGNLVLDILKLNMYQYRYFGEEGKELHRTDLRNYDHGTDEEVDIKSLPTSIYVDMTNDFNMDLYKVLHS